MNAQYRPPDHAIRLWYPAGALPSRQAAANPDAKSCRSSSSPGQNSKRIMRTLFVWVAGATVLAMTAGTASAQYGPRPPGAASGVTGADYHVELSYALWRPNPTLEISSESLGIIGDRIDAVADLGFEKRTFQDFRVVLRPSPKFKFRFGYTPIKYEGDTILTRSIVFNGQRYTVGLPVMSELRWNSWRFGIEYDFISRPQGFFG